MKASTILLTLFMFISMSIGYSQETETSDYIEFNDRKNILHGIYLGVDIGYGQIKKNETTNAGVKLAYVANKKMELGITARALYSGLSSVDRSFGGDFDLLVIYGGLHVENIVLRTSRFNFSFPLLMGPGYVQASGPLIKSTDITLIIEPGINILYNLSKYLQFEAGIKYRFSSPIDPIPNILDNINGFSINIGAKIGVFNLGKNRYKKKAPIN
ncbi:hypothetical protein [Aquimarina sp. 2201CG14-23]|uniref:hypothetical protein n=1 Tax=Aquimarina mycalae TaxID=3040073 RepID=UPI002477F2A7|nr:hypothetical protein [Aquimarina sp. 2201CG14-23]MDH7448232.1 hypothetical protein [Aquimarina sp. 2201CG14-23]